MPGTHLGMQYLKEKVGVAHGGGQLQVDCYVALVGISMKRYVRITLPHLYHYYFYIFA